MTVIGGIRLYEDKKIKNIIIMALCTCILFAGCGKKISERIEVSGKTTMQDRAAYIRIDKEWTFNYYTINEVDGELVVTLYYKPYEEEDK